MVAGAVEVGGRCWMVVVVEKEKCLFTTHVMFPANTAHATQ